MVFQEEDKKMRAYAIIPPMLNQVQRTLRFLNHNGLIDEPMSEYKERKQAISWSTEEKEIFKEKYLERPKQFGHMAELMEKKVDIAKQPAISWKTYFQVAKGNS